MNEYSPAGFVVAVATVENGSLPSVCAVSVTGASDAPATLPVSVTLCPSLIGFGAAFSVRLAFSGCEISYESVFESPRMSKRR